MESVTLSKSQSCRGQFNIWIQPRPVLEELNKVATIVQVFDHSSLPRCLDI